MLCLDDERKILQVWLHQGFHNHNFHLLRRFDCNDDLYGWHFQNIFCIIQRLHESYNHNIGILWIKKISTRLIGSENFVADRHGSFFDWEIEIEFDQHIFNLFTVIMRGEDSPVKIFDFWFVIKELIFTNNKHGWCDDNFGVFLAGILIIMHVKELIDTLNIVHLS